MAEFKLGRIRFIWKNNWTTGTTYVKDDIVRYGGKTYLCVIGHVADTDFYTDLDHGPTRWNQVSDGSEWKGDWTTNTYYKVNDLVKFGGRLYLCNEGHTSDPLATSGASPEVTAGLEADQSKWDLYATSFDWKGDWAVATRYKTNDVVRYGGISYVCNRGHTSSATAETDIDGLEADQSKWDVYAKGFDWVGDWTTGYRYKRNDVVLYGGTSYVCNTGHTSAATATLGLEDDQGLWDYFHKGIEYLGTWSPSSVRYKANDLVKYGADLWICVTDHTSVSLFAEENWSLFVGGLEFENSWSDSGVYQPGDVVSYGGYAYVATTNNVNKKPTANASDWDLFTTGFNFVGDWLDATDYKVGDVLRLNGYTYVVLLDHTSDALVNIPPNGTYWSRLNSGIKWASTDQTFSGIVATTVSGIGSGGTFTVVTHNTTYNVTNIGGVYAGDGYEVGDTLKILGTDVGGVSPANDITITVTGVSGGSTGPITTFTWVGASVSWAPTTDYVLGDAVVYGVNSYICVLAHTSAVENRPDADVTGTYWNLLAAGSITSTLTTQGDLVYMGGAGPTRLGIGTDGQVLRVDGDKPSWSYFGVVNNVVYVANSGADVQGAGQGLTIDKPWKTVRFAAKQIEDGYLNQQATALIAKNKQFLVKEIQNFVQYNYTVSISAASSTLFTCTSTAQLSVGMPIKFTGTVGGVVAGTTYYIFDIPAGGTTFGITNTSGGVARRALTPATGAMDGTYAYSTTSTQRDAGIVVDALVFDIGHSGTLQTTTAALAYFATGGASYVSGVYAYDIPQFVGALNYLKTLVSNVLANTTPVKNYQTLNGVLLANQAIQIIDPALTAETDTATTATNLIQIVVTGLTAGTTSAIPAVINPGTTISIKTGTYTEVLPIVVPKNTAIVGDELRSSVVQPATANLNLANDKPKTISVLNRLKAIVPDLVTNEDVTPTAGNTQSQVRLGFSGTTATASVIANTSTLATIVNNGLGSVPAFTITDPTSGSGNASDSGYFNARRLIVANKTMIQDEIVAYMTANYSSLWTSLGAPGQANCTRDIGYIVDALRYDLSYGGNLETLVVARSYYSDGAFVENSNEKVAALAVQAYLKSFIDNIALGTTGWGKLTATAQDVSGTPGSAGAAAFAQARVQEIYDTIDTGSVANIIAPSTSWVSSGLVNASNAVLARKAALQASTIAWVNATYPSLVYNTVTCSRDVGYIIDALVQDFLFASNFRSVKAAMAYYRGTASAQYVIANQKTASVGVINYIGAAIEQITSGLIGDTGSTAAVNSVVTSAAIISNLIQNGAGVAPALVFPAYGGYNTLYGPGYGDGKAQIAQNYAFIKDEIAEYLDVNYNSIWTGLGPTGQAACTRDVGYLLDAIQYDMTYLGNLATVSAASAYFSNATLTISSTEKAATVAAYTWLKSFIDNIATADTAGWTKNSSLVQTTTGTAGSAESGAFAAFLVQYVIDYINTGVSPSLVVPTDAINQFDARIGYDALIAAKAEIQADTVAWVSKYYQSMPFNTATCSRDAGYIVDAIAYDLVFGSNYNSVSAGRAYSRATASAQYVIANQLEAELGAVNFIGQKAKRIAARGASAQLLANIDDMIYAIAGVVNTTATASTASGNTITVGTTAGVYPGMTVVFNTSFGNIEINRTYWVLEVVDNTTLTLVDSYGFGAAMVQTNASTSALVTIGSKVEVCGTNVYNNVLSTMNSAEILRANTNFLAYEATAWVNANYGGTATSTTASTGYIATSSAHNLTVGDPVIFAGTTFGGIVAGTVYYVAGVPTATEFTVATSQGSLTPISLSDASGSMTVRYSFNAASCRRDMTAYVDALVYDLNYLGNYKSQRATTLYNNSVAGSLTSNMFLLRNGTGLRNMTLSGLTGTLGTANEYGTQRPTAGAYSSLDEGYGPTDSNVWITPRSPYCQNVTMFGTGCIGMKIDAALHTGGNKSIVANDYTTLLSDGIGVWCTGSNALTELVSVFAYYSYAGYLAEFGGKIRATNGNNSYGTYGSLAEGVDTYEVPITATINNRYYQAQIGAVVTDSTNNIYRLEYTNAGSNYNNATYSISGTGYNASTVGNEFRDSAVYESRLLTNGANYVSTSNVAQGGSATSITLAATDSAISAAYIGMRVLVSGGTGVGQTGYFTTYNSGTKAGIVAKESFTTLNVTAAGSNLLTVTSTASLYANMPIIFTGTVLSGCTLAAGTIYYVVGASITATQFSVSTGSGGSAISVGTASSGGPMVLNAVGWDHIVPGTAIAAFLDLTSAYVVEPRVTFGAAPYATTSITSVSAAWTDMVYGDTNVTYNGVGSAGVAASGGAGSNATFTVIRTGTAYTVTTNVAGTGYKLNDTLTILGTSLGGTSTNNITIIVNNVNTSTGAINNFTYTGVGAGGYFVAIQSGSTATQVSADGTGFVAGGAMASSATWGAIAYGAGRWVAVANSASSATNWTADPTTAWTAGGALPATGNWTAICYGNNNFMAVQSGSTNAAYSTNGVSWFATAALPASTTWSGVAYGNGVYVAIASGGTQAAISTDGLSWTSKTLPASATWSSVTFGRGVFVAVASGSRISAYSKDGLTWIQSAAGLPVSQAWSEVRYGQGLFLAVSTGSTAIAASSEDGINWTARTLSGSASWPVVAFGNPSSVPVWVALKTSAATADSISVGCTAQGRVKVSNGAISEIRIVEPGSGYTVAPLMEVTDPNQTSAATWNVRIGNGALANPTFTNRGLQYATATATVTGNGYADMYQDGYYVNMAGLPSIPTAGSNVQIALNNNYYKLVQVSNFLGTGGGQSPYTARFQISPALTASNAPAHGAAVTIRLKYSQVRLTGHDFLSIGTGGIATTNYPNTPTQAADVNKQTVGNGGGRVFYTATDQDGNFTVGTLFSVQQATGVASINADAFNLAGLNSLTLGSVALGGSGATVTSFSTDQYFTANSDNIVPTQKAIKSYISSQIGGGSSALNVNTLTAGVIYIAGNSISTTTGVQINVTATMNFTGGINGMPIAMDFLLLG